MIRFISDKLKREKKIRNSQLVIENKLEIMEILYMKLITSIEYLFI